MRSLVRLLGRLLSKKIVAYRWPNKSDAIAVFSIKTTVCLPRANTVLMTLHSGSSLWNALANSSFLVEATGIEPKLLSDKTSQYSREHVGSDYIGWLHFQTLYSHIAATQPDMFD